MIVFRFLWLCICIYSCRYIVLAQGQEQWGIKECVHFAMKNSYVSSSNKIALEGIRNQRALLKNELLPSSTLKVDSRYDSNASNGFGQMGLNIQLPLFKPSTQLYLGKEVALNSQQEHYQKKHTDYQIISQTIDLYIDFCIWSEILSYTQKRVESLNKEIEKLSLNINAGKAHEYQKKEYIDILIQEQILLEKHREELKKRRIELLHYIGASPDSNILLSIFSMESVSKLINRDFLYQSPHPNSANTILENLKYQKAIIQTKKQKTLLYPTLSLFSSSVASWEMSSPIYPQIKTLLYPVLGIDLEFNISYIWKHRSSIQKYKIEQLNAEIRYKNQLKIEEKEDLLNSSEIYSGKKQFALSKERLENSIEVEKYKQILFLNGRINLYELESSILKKREAQIAYIQSGYNCLNKILKWYLRKDDDTLWNIVLSLYSQHSVVTLDL